jgi:urease accessory protein
MSTDSKLYRLLSWLSPAFPVGAYSFSHGLECAIEAGLVCDADTTRDWIGDLLLVGDGQADLVFLAAAWHAAGDAQALLEVHELALAFQPSAEIRLETTAQGGAFIKAMAAAWPCELIAVLQRMLDGPVAYPVAVGVAARGHDIALEMTAETFAHACASNLVSAAIRLVPLGQTEGQQITARLMSTVTAAVASAIATPLQMVTSSCIMADIMSMRHETQYTRLFRS